MTRRAAGRRSTADGDGDQAGGSGGPNRSGGRLVLVATPIGNLGDLSKRATETLAAADFIYAEDTRHTRGLLTHAGVSGATLRSLHEHNEAERIVEVLRAVSDGAVVVVVSDAGTPGVSDPGSRLVAAAADAGLPVSVVPGPSAVLAALVASGLPTDRFCFEGFIPRSGAERNRRLAVVADDPRTTVIFEAPGRVAATLADLAEACGPERPVAVARELTKLHEEIWRGTLADGARWAEQGAVRGEVVLVVGGAPAVPADVSDEVLAAALRQGLEGGERVRGVVDEVAAAFDVPRRRVYELALGLSQGPADDGEVLP